ncbi:DUF3363 domain-containing protein [Myxococcus sp. MISCRS1]|uniref:DUF3363 domain-containing protein n=1 Tax=Myxococcus sp. MISCRS1 TaxID=2996786 RepID=UPI002270510F|nr:DUF3363 domain-containing protein [Myxococcus sp. MISCRS1]MCY1003943.1 DUF3363 domain-containing protein [Myxococcus sp. MISCRS1]
MKLSVVQQNEYGRKAARMHIRYIEREGVEKDGGRGQLYGPGGPLSLDEALPDLAGEPHQFRLIVSPEDGASLDLRDFVPRLMEQMQRDLGRRFDWVASNHHNTDNPHAHVVIRGLGADGHELRMDRAYVSNGIRWRAQAIATAELGQRNVLEVQQQLNREVRQERVTSLDRELEKKGRATPGVVELSGVPADAGQRMERARLMGRLATLERLGLARPAGPGRWRMESEWTRRLQAHAERNDIIKRMHQGLQGDPSRYRIVEGARDLPVAIEGVVRFRGLHNEGRGTHFVCIETAAGEGYYLPLRGLGEDIREGEVVSAQFSARVLAREDSAIEAVTRLSRGIYSPEVHLKALEEGRVQAAQPEGPRNSHQDVVKACVRRLAALEGVGLAVRTELGWKVTPGLPLVLENAGTAYPKLQKLRIERKSSTLATQRAYRGPTWLDTAAPPVVAPHGFGAELAAAIRSRRAFLKTLGLAPGEKLLQELRKLEMKDTGERLAQQQGAEYVPALPKKGLWKGRVVLTKPNDVSGRRFAQVYREGRFVLLPVTAELRKLDGQRVEVGRENGELVVRRAGPRRGA